LQVQHDLKVVDLKDFNADVDFCFQNQGINSFFSAQSHHFMLIVKNKLGLKLQLNAVEVNEVNIFCLLLSTAMGAIIEYTIESFAF
jgi:hypothetical protein